MCEHLVTVHFPNVLEVSGFNALIRAITHCWFRVELKYFFIGKGLLCFRHRNIKIIENAFGK